MKDCDVCLIVDIDSEDSLGLALDRLIDITESIEAYLAVAVKEGYLSIEFSDEDSNTLEIPETWAIDEMELDGEPPMVSAETVFFRKAVSFPNLRKKVCSYVYQIIALNGDEAKSWHRCLWGNDEVPAGTDAIQELVLADYSLIPVYIKFLQTNDMDNEVYQSWFIRYLISQNGASRDTAELLIDRLLGCHGQFGLEDMSDVAPIFSDFVQEKTNVDYMSAVIVKEVRERVGAIMGKDLICQFVGELAELIDPENNDLKNQLLAAVL